MMNPIYQGRCASAHRSPAKPGHETEQERKPQFLAKGYLGSGKWSGKVALITGGDSGIGRAVAVLFAREGANVAIAYLDAHDDAAITVQYVQAEGRQCIAMAGDVGQAAFCHSLVQQRLQAFGRLDILVNNAAFQQQADTLEAMSSEQLERTLRTNVFGYLHMTRAALPCRCENALCYWM